MFKKVIIFYTLVSILFSPVALSNIAKYNQFKILPIMNEPSIQIDQGSILLANRILNESPNIGENLRRKFFKRTVIRNLAQFVLGIGYVIGASEVVDPNPGQLTEITIAIPMAALILNPVLLYTEFAWTPSDTNDKKWKELLFRSPLFARFCVQWLEKNHEEQIVNEISLAKKTRESD